MPKHNITVIPGEHLPDEVLSLISKYFNEKEIDKLKKFGGRIQISLTAPYTDRKGQKAEITINSELIETLKRSEKVAQNILGNLTLKQIKELAKYLNFPIASNVKVGEARNQLITHLYSGENWNKISGK